MQEISLFPINETHISELVLIAKNTFYETFSPHNSEEEMQVYLENAFTEDKLLLELQNPNSLFYFAKQNDEVLGYLKVNFNQAQTENLIDNTTEIERIYVLNAFQGKKVGQLLFEKALQLAKEKTSDYLWLGVWEDNKKAIAFYEKQGFEAFDSHVFMLGTQAQTDIMMRLDIRN